MFLSIIYGCIPYVTLHTKIFLYVNLSMFVLYMDFCSYVICQNYLITYTFKALRMDFVRTVVCRNNTCNNSFY